VLHHRARPVVALCLWTLFVWTTRIRNVLGDDDLGAGGRAAGLAVSGSFVVLAVVVLAAVRGRSRILAPTARALAAWTVAVWLVRGTAIALGDHAATFVVVHLLLALVSIGLAVLAWRALPPATSRRQGHTTVSSASRDR
jgi:hypothetical protein